MNREDIVGKQIVRIDRQGIPITIEDNNNKDYLTINGISEKVKDVISFINSGMYQTWELVDKEKELAQLLF